MGASQCEGCPSVVIEITVGDAEGNLIVTTSTVTVPIYRLRHLGRLEAGAVWGGVTGRATLARTWEQGRDLSETVDLITFTMAARAFSEAVRIDQCEAGLHLVIEGRVSHLQETVFVMATGAASATSDRGGGVGVIEPTFVNILVT